MCIIAYKPMGRELPTKSVLEECFRRNPDGAGFMWNTGKTVEIRKGFMGFRSFWKALREIEDIKNKEVVMHFRISTQAGINKECTHPFPLSDNMADLKKLNTSAEIGVAHNGIIDLTTSYKKDIDHSDTMEFITKYLSLMIKDWSYYKDHNILTLIERLIDSKMCILDKNGHVELIGKFIEDDGMFYSNSTYKPYGSRYNYGAYGCYDSYTNDDYYAWDSYYGDKWDKFYGDKKKSNKTSTKYIATSTTEIKTLAEEEAELSEWVEEEAKMCYDSKNDIYYFDELYCPEQYGYYNYCEKCVNYAECYGSYVRK